MTTEQWERENQDTLMEYFIDGDPSVRRIQCEYCRKVLYTQTRSRKYCSFQTCGHKMLNLRKKYSINVVAIIEGKNVNTNIDPEVPLTQDMRLIVIANRAKLNKLK